MSHLKVQIIIFIHQNFWSFCQYYQLSTYTLYSQFHDIQSRFSMENTFRSIILILHFIWIIIIWCKIYSIAIRNQTYFFNLCSNIEFNGSLFDPEFGFFSSPSWNIIYNFRFTFFEYVSSEIIISKWSPWL